MRDAWWLKYVRVARHMAHRWFSCSSRAGTG
jgi:hypothetical protein